MEVTSEREKQVGDRPASGRIHSSDPILFNLCNSYLATSAPGPTHCQACSDPNQPVVARSPSGPSVQSHTPPLAAYRPVDTAQCSLQRNLQYGQYYVLVLVLITGALCLYLRGYSRTAGLLITVACGLKIFPILFALYWLRKGDARALLGIGLGITAVGALSIAVFGVDLSRLYLTQILPSALRGEAMDPYNLSLSSISSLLHRLFVAEPDWNPHPALNAPVLVAILQPLLQLLVLAPVILITGPRGRSADRTKLEWCSLVLALLAMSTMLSYHFVLLLLPVAVLVDLLVEGKTFGGLALVVCLYLAVGWPIWRGGHLEGWLAFFAAPRLYCVLLLCAVAYLKLRTLAISKMLDVHQRWAGDYPSQPLWVYKY